MRADIHTLFDLGLMAVGADGRLLVSEKLDATEYADFKGALLRETTSASQAPSAKDLAWHGSEHGWDGADRSEGG